MTVRLYSTTAASNNSAPPNGWPEGQAASTVNDCARQMMAEVRDTYEELPYFDWGNTPTRIDNTNFSVTTDLTARYAVGCRVKLVGATTGYGRITASVFGAVTTITVVMDSGNVPASLTRVAVSPALGLAGSFTSLLLNGTTVGVGANPSASIGLSTVNGSATTFMRSDGAPALSQSIEPNMSGLWTFSNVPSSSLDGSILLKDSNNPLFAMQQSGASANNGIWDFVVSGEAFLGRTANDSGAGNVNWLKVDRTGTTVDTVEFPTDGATRNFVVGTTAADGALALIRTGGNRRTLDVRGVTSAQYVLGVWGEATNHANLISFETDSGASLRGSISYNSGGGVIAYNTTSDERLKTAIADAGSAIGLLMSVPVSQYDWIETGIHVDFGFVAQRLHKAVPIAVSVPETEEGIWQVDNSKLVPLLTKAMQEMIAECRSQRELIESIGTRLAKLEAAA